MRGTYSNSLVGRNFDWCVLLVILCRRKVKSMCVHNPYVVLDLPYDATLSTVRCRFRTLALVHHPDKKHSATPSSFPFHVILDAAKTLLDPFLRAQLDADLHKVQLRSIGQASDVVPLNDFHVEKVGNTVRLFQLDCRCGGTYVLFVGESDRHQSTKLFTECDSCSLVIEVVQFPAS